MWPSFSSFSRSGNSASARPWQKRARRRVPNAARPTHKLAIEPLEDRRLLSFAPELLKDINQVPDFGWGLWNPVESGGKLFFLADDLEHGTQLWKSDGTEAGTGIVTDVLPEVNTEGGVWNMTAMGDSLYFTTQASSDAPRELWNTDGTTSTLVTTLTHSPQDGPFTVAEDTLYFRSGGWGEELWRSDGTAGGTRLLTSIDVIAAQNRIDQSSGSGGDLQWSPELTPVGSSLYFLNAKYTGGGVVDGVMLGPYSITLWRTDGSDAGTVPVQDFPSMGGREYLTFAGDLTAVGDTLFFRAWDPTHSTELWKSGPDGTAMVTSVNVGWYYGFYPNDLTAAGNALYFKTDPYFSSSTDHWVGGDFWKSNGFEEGTVPVSFDGCPTTLAGTTVIGDSAYFTRTDSNGELELCRSDLAAEQTYVLKHFYTGESLSGSLTPVSDTLFFTVQDGSDYSLWKVDADATSAVPYPGLSANGLIPQSTAYTAVGGTLYFPAYRTATNGYQIWKTNDTGGIDFVSELYSMPDAGSGVSGFYDFDGTALFVAGNGVHGPQLWRSDGTPQGTVLLAQDVPDFSGFTRVGRNLLFSTSVQYWNGRDRNYSSVTAWKTDGSASGTVRLRDAIPGWLDGGRIWLGAGETFYSPVSCNWTAVGDSVYFISRTNLVKTGLTADSTVTLSALPSDAVTFGPTVGNTLYFTVRNAANALELWKTDGTEAETKMLTALPSDAVTFGPAVGDTLYFTVYDSANAIELWKTDGTGQGTKMVEVLPLTLGPLVPPYYGLSLSFGPAVGNTLYFTTDDRIHFHQLWRTDGTEAGTELVKDDKPYTLEVPVYDYVAYLHAWMQAQGMGWQPPPLSAFIDHYELGPSTSDVWDLTPVDGLLYFTADDGIHGRELWSTDGTPEGTLMVKDINPGAGTPAIADFKVVGGTLYFTADDGVHGRELWRTDPSEGAVIVGDFYPGADSSGVVYRAVIGQTLVFTAYDPTNGWALWNTSGETTETLAQLVPPGGEAPSWYRFLPAADKWYFFVGGSGSWSVTAASLWTTDGTPQGTSKVEDLPCRVRPFPYVDSQATWGNMVFWTGEDDEHGWELWMSDGTPGNAGLVADIWPGPVGSDPGGYTLVGETFYFTAWHPIAGLEPWVLRIKPPVAGMEGNDLIVRGTSGIDMIDISAASGGLVTALVNGVSYGPFSVPGQVLVDAGDGDDYYTVHLGNWEGTVSITDQGGPTTEVDNLKVFGVEDGDNYIEKTGQITWGNPITETVSYSGIEHLTLVLGPYNNKVIDPDIGPSGLQDVTIEAGPLGSVNTILIANTAAAVVIEDGGGTNDITIGMGNLGAPVTVNATSGTNQVTIDALSETNVLTLSAAQLASATETINLLGSAPSSLDLNLGAGTNSVQIESTSTAGVTINAQGGTNSYVVDMGSLAGAVAINAEPGTSGTSEVTIVAPPGSNELTLSETGLTGAGETINLNLGSTLTELAVDGSAGDNQLVVEGPPPAPLTLENVVVNTTTTVTSSANPSILNSPVTFTAWVSAAIAAAGIPEGTVQFQVDGANLGDAVPLSGGSASVTTSALSVGPHTVTAVYSGAPLFVQSSGDVVQNVHYATSGFLAPLSQNMYFALGRTIPIKFQLTDASGSLITSMSAVESITVTGPGGTFSPPPAAGGTGWRNDGTQYVYNWQTSKTLAQGSYNILVTLADGSTIAKDIQLVSSVGSAKLTADSATAAAGGATAGALLGGDVALLVDNGSGQFSADELARVQDVIAHINSVVGPYGVSIYQVDAAYAASANVVLHTSTTSVVGGYADGVLGCTTDLGEITLIQGWNWYTAADSGQIAADQYDFQTAVTHEVGHALGLGHSATATSVMYATLSSGVTSRAITTQDLNVADDGTGPSALRVRARYAAAIDAALADAGRQQLALAALLQYEDQLQAKPAARSKGLEVPAVDLALLDLAG